MASWPGIASSCPASLVGVRNPQSLYGWDGWGTQSASCGLWAWDPGGAQVWGRLDFCGAALVGCNPSSQGPLVTGTPRGTSGTFARVSPLATWPNICRPGAVGPHFQIKSCLGPQVAPRVSYWKRSGGVFKTNLQEKQFQKQNGGGAGAWPWHPLELESSLNYFTFFFFFKDFIYF